jgi:hypothetical protein
MGIITIKVSEQITDPGPLGSGKMGAIVVSEGPCSSIFTVSAKTQTTAWIQWAVLGGGAVITKDGGTAINGETITENTNYTVTLYGYQSPNTELNDYLVQANFTLKDAEAGSVLDFQSVSRFHNGALC